MITDITEIQRIILEYYKHSYFIIQLCLGNQFYTE